MSNWNSYTNGYTQGFPNRAHQPYESPHPYSETEDSLGRWPAIYFRNPSSVQSSNHSFANASATACDASMNSQLEANNTSMPFDYRQFHTTSLSAPQECYAADSGTSSDCFAGAVSAANPASLQYAPEAPLSLMVAEEEGEEEGEERVEKEPSPKPRKQHKRGRPKLNRHGSGSSSSKRVPHSQVERKYRETLNAEMERLRINIPTLPYDGSSLPLPKKPSKAAVIAAAVDYIKQLEAETERFANENEDLRSERYDCI